MKSLMLKLLTTLLILSASVNATSQDEKIKGFFKSAVSNAKDYDLKSIDILKVEPIAEAEGFQAYFVKMTLTLKSQQKDIEVNDIVFSNGKVLAKELLHVNNQKSLKNELTLDVDNSFYDKEHLIEGEFEAKNRLLVFSDPLCPNCMDVVPELIEFVRAHPKDFSLFYYNFPLSMHKGASTLARAMIRAEKDGVKDAILKVYKEAFDFDNPENQIILDEFNKLMKTSYTLQDLGKNEIKNTLESDIEKAKSILVKGTPTLFINGKRDLTKQAYKTMVK